MTGLLSSKLPCFCPDGVCKQPNLRYLSLSEDNQWAVWKSSDYFYPEMIPEPDYSDSGEETGSEDDYKRPFSPDPRSALERLRDMTEVYVSNVNTKKTQPRKAPGKQAGPTSKASPKQASKPAARDASQVKKPPPKSPVAKKRSQSPTEVFKATGQPSTSTKRSKSPPKSRSKSPPQSSKAATRQLSASTKRQQSPERTKETVPKPKSPPTTAGIKVAAAAAERPRAASPDAKTRPVAATPKPQTGGKSSPKPTPPKTKASPEAEFGRKAAGDSKAKALGVDFERSSRTSDQSSAASTGHSSDEDQLIKPRKPYLPSTEKQKLHKELKFSQKYGKPVSPRTELQVALERYTENKIRKELDAEEKSSLVKILEYQAKKIEMQETMDKCPAWLERLQRPPPTWSNPKTEEFYRVHAKVVSSNILTHCFLPEDDTSECSSRTFNHSDSGGSDS